MHGIRYADLDDIPAMQVIGVSAGKRFAEIPVPQIAACADDEPLGDAELRSWIDAGRAWIAHDGRELVGFVVVDQLDSNAHVEEVSVHPEHEGRGHGAALLDAVAAWGGAQGFDAVTLTTFAEVPWNRPFYERRGFRVLGDEEIGPELRARVLHEDGHGMPASIRVCMSRAV